jgi:hypothetical protein
MAACRRIPGHGATGAHFDAIAAGPRVSADATERARAGGGPGEDIGLRSMEGWGFRKG